MCQHVYWPVRYYHRYDLGNAWRPLIPMAGMGLVAVVLVAYFLSLRTAIAARWGDNDTNDNDEARDAHNNKSCECAWMYLHDLVVVYLTAMVLYHYAMTCFGSPGVALPDSGLSKPWSSWKGQGGILGCNAVCNPRVERKRVALYPDDESDTGGISSTTTSTTRQQQVVYIPSVESSYCEHCQIVRPPRCHHSTVFRHCVLQYDHYCIWVNNAIGYNNYRSFFLMVFFLVLACWYGVALLLVPFFQPIVDRIQELGLLAFFTTHFGRLLWIDLPMPLQLLHLLASGRDNVPAKIVVDLVFPLLLLLGIVLGFFFTSHLRRLLNARTTLEESRICDHRSLLTFRRQQGIPYQPIIASVNQFDQSSSLANMKQVLGPNLLLCLLPVRVDPPPPFLPNDDKSK